MEIESTAGEEKLPNRVKWGYGAAAGSESLIWTMFVLLFLFYLTDVVRFAPSTAGAVVLVGVLWGAVLNPLVGIWSDRLKTRWGRRRPFLLAMAVPYGIVSWLLYVDPGWGQRALLIYVGGLVILFFSVFALVDVPYTALAAEMTQNYDERTALVSSRAVFGELGAIAGAGLPLLLVKHFTEALGSTKAGWSLTAALLGGLSVPLILASWKVTRGYELAPEDVGFDWKEAARSVWGNRSFRYTLGLISTGALAVNFAGCFLVYFMKYWLGMNENEQSLAFLILCGCTLVWIPVVNLLSRRLGKRAAYVLLLGVWAIDQGIGMWLVAPGTPFGFYGALFLASSGLAAFFVLILSMIADVVEVDEFRTGKRREGFYSGAVMFSQQIASALAMWLAGAILGWIGYVPDQEQTPTCLLGLRLAYAAGTTLFLLMSFGFCWGLPMTRERHEALREAIRLKKEGMTPHTDESLEVL